MTEYSKCILHPPKITDHRWFLEDFSHYFNFVDEYQFITIPSEDFEVCQSNNYTFFFKLFISPKSISCSLYRYPKTKFARMSCKLCFESRDKCLTSRHFIINYMEESSAALATLVFDSTDLLCHEKRADLFPDKKLIISGEFSILDDSVTIQSFYTPKPCQSMKNHFQRLLESGNGSDVVFEVEGEKLKAHKSILLARSPVFAAMFEHNMIENNTNNVLIVDISEPIFSLLLHFVYTDELPTELDIELGLDLLQAASKYQLDGLKNLCETQLFKLITTDNAEDIRKTAEAHNLTNFVKSIEAFIKSHPKLN